MTRPRTLTKYEDLRRHVRTHPGPWRRSLLEQRFGPRPVARAVHEQDVLTILPGIMITPAGVETTLAKTRAVAMWVGPQCAISGIAAAIMHGIELSPLEHITVQAPRSFKRSAPAWVPAKLRRFLHTVHEGSTSYLEHLARTPVMCGPEFAAFIWQHVIHVEGTTYTADAYHRAARVVVEFDGGAFHTTRHAVARDKMCDARLASRGIQTVRFTFEDIVHRPQWCQQILRQVVDARSAQVRTAPDQGGPRQADRSGEPSAA